MNSPKKTAIQRNTIRLKTEHNMCGHHYMQTNTNQVNKARFVVTVMLSFFSP